MKNSKITGDKADGGKLRGPACEHFAAAFSSVPQFDSPKCESKFRRALRGVPSKSYISRSGGGGGEGEGAKVTLFVRPENLLEFGASVNRQGLENCEATRKILRYLDKNKDEFLKFEHPPKN